MYSRSGFGDMPPFLNFTKATGGSPSVFEVGETWTITIGGPANQPVYLNANGLGAQLMGYTDSSGRFSLSGTMGEGEKGNWMELWYIGGTLSGGTVYQGTLLSTLNFQVIDAPVAQPLQQTGGPDPHQAPGQPGGLPPSGTGCTPGDGWICIGSMAIPTWGLIAAGLGLLLVFSGGRR